MGTGTLQATVAGFRLRRRNTPTADPNHAFYSLQIGEQQVQGMDADATWQPARLRNLSVIGSFAFLDSALVKDNTFPIGGLITAVPRLSARVYANYRFSAGRYSGFALGAGVFASSRQAVDPSNTLFTGSSSLFDARAGYTLHGIRGRLNGATLYVNAKNLGNVRDLLPYTYLGYRVAPVEPRSVYAGISTHF